MKKCKWQKVKRRSLSLSEWHCVTCGKTGYAQHEKPPINCLRISFGVGNYSLGQSKSKLANKILSTKVGSYSLSFVLVIVLIVILATGSFFKCDIYQYLNLRSSVCNSTDIVDSTIGKDYADGLSDTKAITNICDSSEYVDYADVTEYLEIMNVQMEFLDNSIKGDPQKFAENYSFALASNKEHTIFFNEKIRKCFGGKEGNRLAQEVTRINNFTSEKMKVLYNLANN